MNNQNESNQPPEPRSESDWAEFIEQQGQFLTPDSQPQLPLSLDDLDSQQLADLQLDGQLRMLRRLSDPGDSFVDDVLAQTQVDSAADTNSKSRLPVIAPVFDHQTPDPEATSDLATQDDQLNEQKLSPAARENLLPHKTIATLVSIATAIAVGLLIWGMGGDNSNRQTSGPQAGQNLANNSSTQHTDGSVDPANKSIAPTPSADEAIVVHAIPDLKPRSKNEHHSDQPNSIAENPLQQPMPIDNKNPPQPADQPPRGSVEIVDADPVPRLQWHLAIDFQKNGLGSITLNDKPITGSLLVDNADFVLRQLGDELTRRVQFFETRLGSEISGSINIGSTQFPFKNIDELEPTIERACKYFATLESSNLSIGEFAQLRKSIRQMVYKNPTATTSIDLSNRQIAFSTEDEVFTICSVLAASESVLQDTAKQRLAWEQRRNYQVPEHLPAANSITSKAFANFATNGHFVLPTPKTETAKFSSIQKLGEQELKTFLYTTVGSFDLFTNTREFRRAEQSISENAQRFQDRVKRKLKSIAKASPADKPKLTEKILAQVDRTDLESKKYFLSRDIDSQGLPLVMGDECRSSRDDAVAIDWVSSTLGSAVNQFDPSLGSRDPSNNDAFRIRELKKQLKNATDASVNPQHLKTADQILQIDHPRMRLELIEALEKSETDTALKLLAKRAKFDFVPEVRLAATTTLARFPRDQYREELLAGLKYPWHVIAQHSAEALVRLDDQEAIPELVAMLDLPHPNTPVQVDKNKFVKLELVAINHMRNCLLCHAPAGSSHDIATGVIPSWDRPLPKQYYKSENPHSTSVRADVTYLEQDFSVVQPVLNHGLWPQDQRFDYVVQQRPLKRIKANQLSKQFADAPNLNREAIVFALQKLTDENPKDNSSKSWKAILQQREAKLAR